MKQPTDQLRKIGHTGALWVLAISFLLAAILVTYGDQDLGAFVLSVTLGGTFACLFRRDVALTRLVKEVGADSRYAPLQSLRLRYERLIEANRSVSRRLEQMHTVSGLPTREILLIAMESGPGTLGLIELSDFDRMAATDPEQADRVLNELAQRISRMAGVQRLVAHVDRARFAIWFDGEDEAESSGTLRAIAYALQSGVLFDDFEVLPLVRIGHIACDPEAGAVEMILSRAFAILSNQARGTNESLERASVEIKCDFVLEQDLRRAIVNGEFELYFQPFVDARTKAVCGAEALIRWHHPQRGVISPAQFIPVAEAANVASDLGNWVIDMACRTVGSWHLAGMGKLKVAVNLSAQQLQQVELLPLIERSLARHGLPAAMLELELTETVAAIDSTAIGHLFHRLRSLGVSLSIDDFGTGFSSLSYLKNLSFDKLKIDREFVTDVDRRRDCQAICSSIIALGSGLGIDVLAEGVERFEEYAWLRRHGCNLFQGYYFSRPLPAAEFLSFFKDRALVDQLATLSHQTGLPDQRIAS
jgi:EAL domain-containing protein (putative c-di-GMP-specific phosphodiesterase class I)/GGDEF domain-containing protein